MSTILNIICNDQQLICQNDIVVASGGINDTLIHFSFSEDWNGFIKTAAFYNIYKKIEFKIILNNECFIPSNIINKEGSIWIGVFGYKNEITKTTNLARYDIKSGAISIPEDPQESIYEELLTKINELNFTSANVNSNGHLILTLQNGTIMDAGYVIGEQGTQGNQGIQGEIGVGIATIEKNGTDGILDYYVITFTNGDTFSYTITNSENSDYEAREKIGDLTLLSTDNKTSAVGAINETLDKANKIGDLGDLNTTNKSTTVDAINEVFDPLFNNKERGGDKELEMRTVNLNNIDSVQGQVYSTSVFTGWGACIGNPETIELVKFAVKARENMPIQSLLFELYEFPDEMPVQSANYYTPRPDTWKKLLSETISFDEAITNTSSWTVVEHKLITKVSNNTKYLFGVIRSNDTNTYITMKICTASYNDIPFNSWAIYYTGGISWLYSNSVVDLTSKEIKVLPIECYKLTNKEYYSEVGTNNGDKFYTLVSEVLESSGIKAKVDSADEVLSDMFEQVECPIYQNKGSENLTINNPNTTTELLTSTFTGVSFGLGYISSAFPIEGIRLGIRPRAYNGVSNKATKLFIHLYTIDSLPNYALNPTFASLNPVEIAYKEISIDVEVDNTAFIDVYFDSPIYNTQEKFLMLNYNLDTYNNKVYANPTISGINVCKQNDSNSGLYDGVSSLQMYYSCSKNSTAQNAQRWDDNKANAYSFISKGSKWVAGETFNELIEEKVNEATEEYSQYLVPPCEVRLAKKYDLVVGDKFQLFFTGVIKGFCVNEMGINVLCNKGDYFPKYYEWTPTSSDVGSYNLKIQVRRLDGSVISEGTTTLTVNAIPIFSTATIKTVLFFGDSLTSSGVWCSEGIRRLIGNSISGYSGPPSLQIENLIINSYGRKTNTNNTQIVHHEGYGGWTWGSFLAPANTSSTVNGIIITLASDHDYEINNVQHSVWTDENGLKWVLEDLLASNKIKFDRGTGNIASQASTLLPNEMTSLSLALTINNFTVVWESGNPFYNDETKEIDFINHAEECGVNGADIVSCLLTWNGGGGANDGSFSYMSKIATHIANATTLLRYIHRDFPNAKIIVMGIQLSSLTGGTGANYHATGGYSDMWGTCFYAFDYNKALEELVTNNEFGEYCYYVDTKGQFDTINMMPYNEVTVNSRSQETEKRGTNGVHPSTNGYYQIGDALFRKLVNILQGGN